MSAKSEALRLADAIDRYNAGVCSQAIYEDYSKAAAELRRLNEEVETNGTIIQYHEASIARLTSQRDELLEALRVFVSCAYPVSTEIDERGHSWTEAYLDQALPIARAAIKAVEGETK